MDFKEFLHSNRLKQVDIAKFLGITEASVSRLCKGISNPSETNLRKLVNNPYGWDTSALTGSSISARATNNSRASVTINDSGAKRDIEVSMLKEQIANLEQLLEEEKKRSAQYWETIQKLITK